MLLVVVVGCGVGGCGCGCCCLRYCCLFMSFWIAYPLGDNLIYTPDSSKCSAFPCFNPMFTCVLDTRQCSWTSYLGDV